MVHINKYENRIKDIAIYLKKIGICEKTTEIRIKKFDM